MNKHIVFRILAGLVLLAVVAGIAFVAFNTGVVHGAALDIKAVAPQIEGQPLPVHGHGMVFRHVHSFFGFGCFGILLPLFLLFLAFAALRHMLWGPSWGGWGHHHLHNHGPWSDGVPPMFAEWHRRAHAAPPTDDADKK